MRLVVQEDAESVGEWVAHYVQERIRRFKPTAERPFVLGLPTGSSPLPTYRKLVELHKSGQLSFEHVVTVNMDEYVGLSPTHEQSYHAFMWTNLFEHIDIRPENVHILDGMAEDLQAECDKYEAMIEDLGGIELFLGGIGPDGHIAFNEPGSSLCSRTRVKTLAYDTIVANSRFFGGDIAKVPTMALTVGVGTVMDAREVLVIITGVSKALALHKCIEEGVSHMWTVSCLQQHPRACIACDEDATLECKVKTIRYFKGLQDTQLKLLQLPMEGYGGTSLTRGSSTGSAAAAPAPLSSTARMAVQEARKDRLSASSVMVAMSRAAERLSDDRSVSSVDGANAFRELATVAARGKPAAAAAAASAGASSGRAPKRGADDASRSAAKRARDV